MEQEGQRPQEEAGPGPAGTALQRSPGLRWGWAVGPWRGRGWSPGCSFTHRGRGEGSQTARLSRKNLELHLEDTTALQGPRETLELAGGPACPHLPLPPVLTPPPQSLRITRSIRSSVKSSDHRVLMGSVSEREAAPSALLLCQPRSPLGLPRLIPPVRSPQFD